MILHSHSLRGLCGLKLYVNAVFVTSGLSQPARAVWIEIAEKVRKNLPTLSQPARAVWIEILYHCKSHTIFFVTACEGCVD